MTTLTLLDMSGHKNSDIAIEADPAGVFLIGRGGSGCHLSIGEQLGKQADEGVSEIHARIVFKAGRGFILENASSNGTWVKTKIGDRKLLTGDTYALQSHDEIRIGREARWKVVLDVTQPLIDPNDLTYPAVSSAALHFVLSRLDGYCHVHIAGAAGSGRSALLSAVHRELSKGALSRRFVSCYVDLYSWDSALGATGVEQFYRLMVACLCRDTRNSSLAEQPAPGKTWKSLFDAHVVTVRREEGVRLVFVFDHLDTAVADLPQTVWADLHQMARDSANSPLYVMATADELHYELRHIKPSKLAFDFAERMGETYWIKRASEQELTVLIKADMRPQTPTEEELTAVKRLSGGWPGLARQIVRYLARHGFSASKSEGDQQLLQRLLEQPEVTGSEGAADLLWLSLRETERAELTRIVAGDKTRIDATTHTLLQMKGLLDASGTRITVPLLAAYIRWLSEKGLLTINRTNDIVYIGQQPLPQSELSPGGLGFRLLKLLDEYCPTVCKFEEIVRHLYPGDEPEAWKDTGTGTINTQVSRLNKELEKHTGRHFIANVKNVGYKLVREGFVPAKGRKDSDQNAD